MAIKYRKLYSIDADKARNKYLLRILLGALIFLTAFALIFNIAKAVSTPNYHGLSPFITATILFLFSFLFYLAQTGRSIFASYIFISLLFMLNVWVGAHWGVDLPISLLLYSLIIVITGILLSSRQAFFITIASGIVILFIAYCKIHGMCITEDRWRYEMIHMTDAIVYVISLGIIAVVSSLSNREIEKSLNRARKSEAALYKEKQMLEITVAKRTEQLRKAQIEKLSQVYRFTEFGKLASGLFHDFMTPLNIVSLSLENMKSQTKKGISQDEIDDIQQHLQRAVYGTQRLERFIAIARRQLQNTKTFETFSLTKEVKEAIQLLHYSASEVKVAITFKNPQEISYYGNPLRFNQVITNLLTNALDACHESDKKDGITIELFQKHSKIFLIVTDCGNGIKRKDRDQIFNPLFTTKTGSKHMGFGLYIIKDIVENDFHGTISLTSNQEKGTSFTVEFPIREKKKRESA